MNPKDNAHKFSVGDGAHTSFNGDSTPYTVRYVSASGKSLLASRDDFKVLKGGMYEEGPKECVFTPQDIPEKEWEAFYVAKNGRWYFKKSGGSGFTLHLGRVYSRNPHF